MYSANRVLFALAAVFVSVLVGCSNGEQAQNNTAGANEPTQRSSDLSDQEGRHSDLTGTATEADGPQDITPLLAQVPYAPIPFAGSDGRTHLVYELEATNFSSGETTIEQLEVLDADMGNVIDTLDAEEVAGRLQPAGLRDAADTFDPSMTALIFLHVTFDNAEEGPGVFPEGISIEEADGNSVILDLGGGNYALYAHFQPGSIRVEEGDRVKRDDVLALVGNSGNSVAPHLHFHVMGGQLSLASNGLPYIVDSFTVTGRTAGTDAFDEAEAEGTPLEVTPLDPVEEVTDAMPLDQTVVSFD